MRAPERASASRSSLQHASSGRWPKSTLAERAGPILRGAAAPCVLRQAQDEVLSLWPLPGPCSIFLILSLSKDARTALQLPRKPANGNAHSQGREPPPGADYPAPLANRRLALKKTAGRGETAR